MTPRPWAFHRNKMSLWLENATSPCRTAPYGVKILAALHCPDSFPTWTNQVGSDPKKGLCVLPRLHMHLAPQTGDQRPATASGVQLRLWGSGQLQLLPLQQPCGLAHCGGNGLWEASRRLLCVRGHCSKASWETSRCTKLPRHASTELRFMENYESFNHQNGEHVPKMNDLREPTKPKERAGKNKHGGRRLLVRCAGLMHLNLELPSIFSFFDSKWRRPKRPTWMDSTSADFQ